jgi:hypothetical protein
MCSFSTSCNDSPLMCLTIGHVQGDVKSLDRPWNMCNNPMNMKQHPLLSAFMQWLGQRVCAMTGHNSTLHFEGRRVMMRCGSCGYDSPGWDIIGRGPTQRFDGDPKHHAIQQTRLVLRKSA